MEKATDRIILEPPAQTSAAVIWLHGLGADGHDFAAIVPELGLPPDHCIRFVFPHAPVRAITINGGIPMRGWYDITDVDLRATEDEAGIRTSADLISRILDTELERGIPADRLVLAGFSQGGAIALHTGLRFNHRLAGLIALSTYLPIAHSLESEAAPANRDVPIFMGHGAVDPLVPEHLGDQTAGRLKALGYRVEYKVYAMPHAVCAEEIADVSDWLRRVLEID